MLAKFTKFTGCWERKKFVRLRSGAAVQSRRLRRAGGGAVRALLGEALKVKRCMTSPPYASYPECRKMVGLAGRT